MTYSDRLYRSYVTNKIEAECSVTLKDLEFLERYYRKKIIGPFLPKDPNIRILDVGCGYGSFIYACLKAGYKRAIGVDFCPEQVALARRLGIKNVISSDIQNYLAEKKECFEIITAFDVLEHFKKNELFECLDSIYASLSPGGLFILRTPNAEGLFSGRHCYGDLTHETFFNKWSLNQALKTVGFKKMAYYEDGVMFEGIRSGIRFILWKFILSVLYFYTMVECGRLRDKPIFTLNIIAVAQK